MAYIQQGRESKPGLKSGAGVDVRRGPEIKGGRNLHGTWLAPVVMWIDGSLWCLECGEEGSWVSALAAALGIVGTLTCHGYSGG